MYILVLILKVRMVEVFLPAPYREKDALLCLISFTYIFDYGGIGGGGGGEEEKKKKTAI